MKILFISPDIDSGGAENVLFKIAKSNNKKDIVLISLTKTGFYGEKLKKDGYKIYSLNLKKNIFSIFKVFKLYFLINKFKPDIVHTWLYHGNLLGGIISKIAGVKKIYWSIHHDYEYSNLMMLIEMKLLILLSYFIPNKIIFCSSSSSANHIKKGYKESISQIIENGICTSKFKPNEYFRKKLRKKLNLEYNCLLLGNISRYHPIKDHDNLLKALSILNIEKIKFKCILVGEGLTNKNKQLLNKIKNLKLQDKVILHGKSFEINKIMASLDLHILCSKKEAFGMVLLEAMSSGVPCISTNVGEAKSIIGNEKWIIEASDSFSLALKIMDFLKEKMNIKDYLPLTRERILKNYSLEKMISSYRKLYLDIF